jgi:hypothetical protein
MFKYRKAKSAEDLAARIASTAAIRDTRIDDVPSIDEHLHLINQCSIQSQAKVDIVLLRVYIVGWKSGKFILEQEFRQRNVGVIRRVRYRQTKDGSWAVW